MEHRDWVQRLTFKVSGFWEVTPIQISRCRLIFYLTFIFSRLAISASKLSDVKKKSILSLITMTDANCIESRVLNPSFQYFLIIFFANFLISPLSDTILNFSESFSNASINVSATVSSISYFLHFSQITELNSISVSSARKIPSIAFLLKKSINSFVPDSLW